MSIDGSMAGEAFTEAAAVLARHRPAVGARRRIPFDYVTPPVDGPGPARGTEGWAPSGGPDAAAGPLHAAAAALRAGEVSAVALVEAALAAISARDGELVGMAAVDVEGALDSAERLDREAARSGFRSILHGVPMTVKDVIDVAGFPTAAGSAAYWDPAPVDAVAVARLRDAGAVIVGKATTHEFALGVTSPQSRNPHDPTRLPGGSSGGSAISVATGMALASLGTDTRASIRVPAALSGVVGFKPTYGRIPTTGVVTLSWTMDHVAPMAASVRDAAAVLEVLLDDGRVLSSPGPVTGLRVGVPEATFAGCQPGVAAAVRSALDALADAGVTLVPVGRPDAEDLAVASNAGLIVSRSEAACTHRALGLDRSRYWQEVAEQLAEAESIPAVDYLDAQRLRARLAAELATEFDHVDVIAMPTSPVVAPPATDFARYLMALARNAIPWSFVGFPALSVPAGTSEGLPVGLQLVAPTDREDLLAAVGVAVEAVVPPQRPVAVPAVAAVPAASADRSPIRAR